MKFSQAITTFLSSSIAAAQATKRINEDGRSLFDVSAIFPKAQLLGEPTGGQSLAIANFTNNGLDDIIFGNWLNDNEVFLSDSRKVHLLPNVTSNIDTCNVAVGDFDNDGHMDVLLSKFETGSIYLLRNSGEFNEDGNVHFPSKDMSTVFSSNSLRGIHAVDVNNDGNLDIVVTFSHQFRGTHVLLGDGSGSFPKHIQLLDNNYISTSGIGAADFNGDGYVDLVIANEAYEVGGFANRTYNPGTNLFLSDGILDDGTPKFTMVTIPHEFASSDFAIGDIDNDNDTDLVIMRPTSTALLFRNDGTAAFERPEELPGAYNENGALMGGGKYSDMADVNGDGHLDIAIGRYGHPNLLLLNNGEGGFDETGVSELPEPSGLDRDKKQFSQTMGIKFVNLDGDSKPDLVYTNRNAQKVLLTNTSPHSTTTNAKDEGAWQITLTGPSGTDFGDAGRTELSWKLISAIAEAEGAHDMSTPITQVVLTRMPPETSFSAPGEVIRIGDTIHMQVLDGSIVTSNNAPFSRRMLRGNAGTAS